MIYIQLRTTHSLCFFPDRQLTSWTEIINFSVEFWLSRVLLFVDTECNVLEATSTPNSPVPNITHSHLFTLCWSEWAISHKSSCNPTSNITQTQSTVCSITRGARDAVRKESVRAQAHDNNHYHWCCTRATISTSSQWVHSAAKTWVSAVYTAF